MLKFDDISDERWSKKHIDFCIEAGIINGFEDNTFRPTECPTREQMAKMFHLHTLDVMKKVKELIANGS